MWFGLRVRRLCGCCVLVWCFVGDGDGERHVRLGRQVVVVEAGGVCVYEGLISRTNGRFVTVCWY